MCRYVIHTVGPRYNIKYKTAAESALFSSYRSVMKIVRFVSVLVFVIMWNSHSTCTCYSQVRSSVPSPPPKDAINECIIRKLNLLVFVDFRFISAFLYVHWAVNSSMRQLLHFYQLRFPEFYVSNFSFQRFSIWPDTEKFSSNIHHSLRKQECPFEFDASYRNVYWIHFSNSHFINRILGVRLTCLDKENF